MMHTYLREHKIPFERCGKLIVATSEEELPGINLLYEKAQRNGVQKIEKISSDDAKFLEPKVHCVGGLWSPFTSIFDTHGFMTSLVADSDENGANFVYNCDVLTVQYQSNTPSFLVSTSQGELTTDIFINACGHNAPKIQYIVPKEFPDINRRVPTPYFLKGNYFKFSRKIFLLHSLFSYLLGGKLFNHLVYPLPHVTGALGIHATIDLSGMTRFGPDASWIHPSNHELSPSDYQVDESRQSLFESAIRRYYPDLPENSLAPDYSGIRPRLLGPNHLGPSLDQFNRDLSDFVIDGPRHHEIDGLVNLYGIESPGLTCSLPIADYVYELIKERDS